MKKHKKRYRQNYRITFISLDDPRFVKEIERRAYQKYLNRQYSCETKYQEINESNLENVFSNKIYYKAMKDLPLIEKKIIYFDIVENYGLEETCNILNLTKKEVLDYRKKAIKHFKRNVKKYSNKKGGNSNE